MSAIVKLFEYSLPLPFLGWQKKKKKERKKRGNRQEAETGKFEV